MNICVDFLNYGENKNMRTYFTVHMYFTHEWKHKNIEKRHLTKQLIRLAKTQLNNQQSIIASIQ